MVNSLVHRLFDSTEGDVAPGVGPEITPQLNRDEIGVVQVSITGGQANVLIQGRLNDDMPWSNLFQVDELDMDSTGSRLEAIRMMKFMRANVASASGGPVVKVWVQA